MTNAAGFRPAVVGLLVLMVALAAACGGDDGAGDREASLAPQESQGATGAIAPDGGGADGDNFSGGETASGYDASALPATLDRQIIRTATVSLDVDAVSQKFEEVSNIALGAGGFVASSTFGNRDDAQTASVTIRVPATEYDATLRRLRGLGEVKEESSNANDVTEQFTDLESRLRNLQASEERYLDLLTRAGTIADVLAVQDRVNATRAEIEQIQGRIQLLENQSELATITVHLLPPAAAQGGEGADSPLEVAQEAFAASLAVLLGIAMVAIAVAAFSWWLVPLVLGGWYLGRKQLRSRAT